MPPGSSQHADLRGNVIASHLHLERPPDSVGDPTLGWFCCRVGKPMAESQRGRKVNVHALKNGHQQLPWTAQEWVSEENQRCIHGKQVRDTHKPDVVVGALESAYIDRGGYLSLGAYVYRNTTDGKAMYDRMQSGEVGEVSLGYGITVENSASGYSGDAVAAKIAIHELSLTVKGRIEGTVITFLNSADAANAGMFPVTETEPDAAAAAAPAATETLAVGSAASSSSSLPSDMALDPTPAVATAAAAATDLAALVVPMEKTTTKANEPTSAPSALQSDAAAALPTTTTSHMAAAATTPATTPMDTDTTRTPVPAAAAAAAAPTPATTPAAAASSPAATTPAAAAAATSSVDADMDDSEFDELFSQQLTPQQIVNLTKEQLVRYYGRTQGLAQNMVEERKQRMATQRAEAERQALELESKIDADAALYKKLDIDVAVAEHRQHLKQLLTDPKRAMDRQLLTKSVQRIREEEAERTRVNTELATAQAAAAAANERMQQLEAAVDAVSQSQKRSRTAGGSGASSKPVAANVAPATSAAAAAAAAADSLMSGLAAKKFDGTATPAQKQANARAAAVPTKLPELPRIPIGGVRGAAPKPEDPLEMWLGNYHEADPHPIYNTPLDMRNVPKAATRAEIVVQNSAMMGSATTLDDLVETWSARENSIGEASYSRVPLYNNSQGFSQAVKRQDTLMGVSNSANCAPASSSSSGIKRNANDAMSSAMARAGIY